MDSALPSELFEALRANLYTIHAENNFVMTLGVHCPDLQILMATNNEFSAAFLCANNPFGLRSQHAANKDLTHDLRTNIQSRGLRFFEGVGHSPADFGHEDRGFLVLGLALGASRALARHFNQLAFVWSAEDGVPMLYATGL